MLINSRYIKKLVALATATTIALFPLMALTPQSVSAAAAQVTSRSVKLTSSSTAVLPTTTYTVTATVATSSASMKGVVVDFCSNSPIVGDNCTTPTSFTVGGAPSVTTNGVLTASGWTASSSFAVNTLLLSNTTGVATTGGTSIITFDIANVQNPTTACTGTNCTFYARIYTYNLAAGATGFNSHTNPDGGAAHIDEGGMAMSTANQVTVTAKVQESLLFCVYTTGTACSGSSIAGIPLGDANGVLSVNTTVYIAALKAQLGLASNASQGVIVRAKGATLTTPNPFTIAATGSTCTADDPTATTEQFGFRITAAAGGTGTQTVPAKYSCLINNHSFDTANLATTYGDQVLSTAGPSTEATTAAALEFEGKAATTTKPGIYTSTLTFIATGIY